MLLLRSLAFGFSLFIAGASSATRAQEADAFYKGKTIRLLIPSGPGGTYAAYGDVIARFMSRHLPGNPSLVMQFIPSDIQAMNSVGNVATRDGLTISLLSQTAAITQVLSPDVAKYDLRTFAALGMIARFNAALTVSTKLPVRTPDDLKSNAFSLGATDTSSYQYRIPEMMNRYLGAKIKIITGYKDIAESTLALARGEVDGVFTSWLAVKEQRASGALPADVARVILQVGRDPEPDLDAPLLQSLAIDDKSSQAFAFMASFTDLSRGMIAPPNVPPDRLATLREAAAAMIANPEFATALSERRLPFRPLSWQDQQDVMDRAVATPRDLVK